MKTLILLLFSVMAFSQTPSNGTQTLVIIGDSLTEGLGVSNDETYISLLQNRLKKENKNWTIVNHGISGSTTASAPSRVKWVLKKPPQLVVIALGANDGLRGLKPELTEKNLDEAITALKKAHVKVILAEMKAPPNYTGKYGKEFEAVYERLAKKHSIKQMPFILDGVAGHPEFNQKDGIHPNAKGHAKIAETVYKALQTEL